MILLLLVGIAYVIPNYPAHLFGRLMVPAGIFLSGIISTSLVSVISFIWPRTATNGPVSAAISQFPSSDFSITILKPTACALIVILLLYNISVGTIKTVRIIICKSTVEQMLFDMSQPEIMLNLTDDSSTILYDADTSMFFYFAKGALKRHSVHYFAVKDTPDEVKWLDAERICYAIGYNRIKEGRIRLSAGKTVTVQSESPCLLNSLFLNINNLGPECAVNINLMNKLTENISHYQLMVPQGYSGWLQCVCNESMPCYSFTMTINNGVIDIFGVRISNDLELNWPWNQGIAISYVNAFGEHKTANFNTCDGYYPDIGCKYKVIADRGTSLLLKAIYK